MAVESILCVDPVRAALSLPALLYTHVPIVNRTAHVAIHTHTHTIATPCRCHSGIGYGYCYSTSNTVVVLIRLCRQLPISEDQVAPQVTTCLK